MKTLLCFAIMVLLAAQDALPETAPMFSKRTLKIDGKTVQVEIADSDAKRSYGLMNREKLKDSEGMLFVFDDEQHRTFWMHNTLIPLSIGFFNSERTLVDVQEMQPEVLGTARPKTYTSRTKAMYALEMNEGWFKKNQIRPRAQFRFADKQVRK